MWFQKWRKHEKSKLATNFRSVCLIHDNTGAHQCKLIQDFLETDTVVHLHNPPFLPVLSLRDFLLLTLLKISLSRRQY